jgi:hypothetical protein
MRPLFMRTQQALATGPHARTLPTALVKLGRKTPLAARTDFSCVEALETGALRDTLSIAERWALRAAADHLRDVLEKRGNSAALATKTVPDIVSAQDVAKRGNPFGTPRSTLQRNVLRRLGDSDLTRINLARDAHNNFDIIYYITDLAEGDGPLAERAEEFLREFDIGDLELTESSFGIIKLLEGYDNESADRLLTKLAGLDHEGVLHGFADLYYLYDEWAQSGSHMAITLLSSKAHHEPIAMEVLIEAALLNRNPYAIQELYRLSNNCWRAHKVLRDLFNWDGQRPIAVTS